MKNEGRLRHAANSLGKTVRRSLRRPVTTALDGQAGMAHKNRSQQARMRLLPADNPVGNPSDSMAMAPMRSALMAFP